MSDTKLNLFKKPADQTTTGNSNFKKADAFLNIGIRNGEVVKKLGKNGIPLYADNPFHVAIINALSEGKSMDVVYDLHIVEAEASVDDFDDFFK